MITINNENFEAILDTGADISIVYVKMLPKMTKIKKNLKFKVKSACGNSINIIGSVSQLKISYKNIDYEIDALVTDRYPKHIILGSPFIVKHPKLILNLVEKKKKIYNIELEHEFLSLENDLKLRFKQSFATEINNMKICTTGTHYIKTNCESPLKQNNYRIP
ncbi:hypothetical protein COBT_001162, partial [Conglomerata obtusa]